MYARLLPLLTAVALVACKAATPPPPQPPCPNPQPQIRLQAPKPPLYTGGAFQTKGWPEEADLAAAETPVTALRTDAVKTSSQKEWHLYEIHPRNPMPPLAGRTVGVLASADPSWGDGIGSRAEDVGPREMFAFSAEGSPPFVAVLASRSMDSPSATVISAGTPHARAMHRFNAITFSPESGAQHGMGRSAQLVELEVNGGLGSPGQTPYMAATRGRVLDGTKRYPGKVDQLLVLLRKHFDVLLEQHRPPIEDALTAFRDRLPEEAERQPLDERIGAAPSWLHERERLSVLFYWRLHDLALGPVFKNELKCLPCEAGQPCRPCPGPQRGPNRYTLAYHFAARFELSMDGTLHTQKLYLPAQFMWGLTN